MGKGAGEAGREPILHNANPNPYGPAAMMRGAGILRVFAFALLGIAAAATIISLIGPSVDLEIARLFFDPATGKFLEGSDSYLPLLRDHGYAAIAVAVGAIIAALVTRLVPKFPLKVSVRAAIFLASSLALGPGLLINGIVKENSHRPRPFYVTEFGGDKTYVNWWNFGGDCTTNCSFASGEVGAAAWMFAPAMLAPPAWRVAALGAAAIFTVTTALSRMSVAAHFLTDVVFGALLTLLVVWLMHDLIFHRLRKRLPT